MKLETRLGLSSGILILAMLVSAFTAHLRLMGVAQMAHEIDDQRRPFILSTQILNRDLTSAVVALQSSIVFAPSSTMHANSAAALQDAHKAIDADLVSLKGIDDQLDLGPDEGKLDGIAQQLRETEDQERIAAEQSSLTTPAAAAHARAILEQQVLPLSELTQNALSAIIANQTRIVSTELEALHRANSMTVLTLWSATILGALLGGSLSHLLARRISRSIGLVADRANAIAAGDLTGAPLNIDSTDQIGSLARAMQQMQTSLGHIISTVAQTSSSITASAISMSAATDHIHRRVDRQTQQTQQAATAMQEMSASIAEVSRHAQSAAETARSAARTAHEGGEIVTQMLSSMHSIATAVSDTSSTIGLLGEDSRRISQIVTVIDEIATKTNLLALNAAIEAARAGDHGRGFAVVAGEVRHLAESTAQATSEIATMIQEIQQRTRTAIASMASGTLTVEQGVATTNKAGGALERIIGIAERVDRMIAQIAIAASQQASAADQSSASLDSIHTLSIDNLSEMATTTNGIENLRATAAALASQVESFRLDLSPTELTPPRKPLSPRTFTRPSTA
jgi:methyl-accepting chemotaxis protein